MVLAERYLRHLREKRLAEGRAETRAECAPMEAALEEAQRNGEDSRVIAAYQKMLRAIDD